MPWHFQIISVTSFTFALIFCAWISVCRWFEKPQDQCLSSGCRFDISSAFLNWNQHIYLIIAPSPGLRCSVVTKIAMAQPRRACPSCRRRLRADWSRRPDLIKFGDLPALALPRDKLAVATARRKCGDRRRARQPWQRSDRMYVHVFAPKMLTEIRADTCIYMHTVSPARCQYLHVYAGNTDTYCSSQVDILLQWSQIRAYTCIYVHIRSLHVCIRACTYAYGVCRMLHVYARIIETLLAYKSHCICNYMCKYTCIYFMSGSLMRHP